MKRLIMPVLLLTLGCAGGAERRQSPSNVPVTEIREDRTVSGTFRVRGELKVLPGVVLTVRPGTRFLFEPFDADGDGVNDSRLVVEGTLIARGTPGAPIFFTSASRDPMPGDWLELRVDRSEGTVLEHCVLEYSRYGFHAHFSSGVIANSVLRNNIDGTRFGNARYVLYRNRIEGNSGKGINFRDSGLTVTGNRIGRNRYGIFIFEEGADALITLNLFYGNGRSDIHFGDFYTGGNPILDGNRSDGGSTPSIGGTDQEPEAGDSEMVPSSRTGPVTSRFHVDPLWETDLGSFVDAPPVLLDDGRIAAASWEGGLFQIALEDGRVLSQLEVGDVVDAQPALFRDRLIFPAWDRRVRFVDTASGRLDGYLEWDVSPADDHRQAAPLVLNSETAGESLVIQGLWNGQLGAIDPSGMKWKWFTALEGAIRAKPAFDSRNLWVGTDGGYLYEISLEGEVLTRIPLGSPVRTTPAPLHRGDVAVINRDGVFSRIRDGKVVWSRRLPGDGTYASPVSGTGRVPSYIYTGDGSGAVSLFDAGGALLWRNSLGSPVHALGLRGQILWAGTQDGRLSALNPVTGSVHGYLEADGAVHAPPLAAGPAGDVMIWGSRDGKVRAHRVKVLEEPWEMGR